jgi:copper chaperone CopZ
MTIKGFQVAHAMPGRVRLKVDKVKDNPAFARKAQEELSRMPGVKEVEVKPLTGSVLIHYDTAVLLAEGTLAAYTGGLAALFPELGAAAATMGLQSLIGRLAGGQQAPSANSLMTSLGKVNAEVARLTGGFDLKLLIPTTLLFFGVRSLWTAKKVAVPAWFDYLWFAFSTFVMLNQRTFDTGKAEAGSSVEEGQGTTTARTGKKQVDKG